MPCEICGSNKELNSIADTEFKKVCKDCYFKIKRGEVITLGELGDFAKRNSQFVALEDGESIEAVYEGFKIAENPFDSEKEVINYKLNTDFGIKTFRSGACGLARIFDNIKPKTELRITRHGTGNKTSYKIEEKIKGEWVSIGKPAELEAEE